MGGAEDFFNKLGGNLEAFGDKASGTLFGILNIPAGLANTAQKIGNGIADFVSNPLSAIAIPAVAIAGVILLKGK